MNDIYPLCPDRDARNRERRRSRLIAARKLGTHTKPQWEILLAQCQYKCVKCGRTGYHLDKDHIIPLYLGGSDAIGNIQPLCAWCNAGKGPEGVDYRPPSATARSLIAIQGIA